MFAEVAQGKMSAAGRRERGEPADERHLPEVEAAEEALSLRASCCAFQRGHRADGPSARPARVSARRGGLRLCGGTRSLDDDYCFAAVAWRARLRRRLRGRTSRSRPAMLACLHSAQQLGVGRVSSSFVLAKFDWPRSSSSLPRIAADLNVASGPADWPKWTIRARGAAISAAASTGSPQSASMHDRRAVAAARAGEVAVERHRRVGSELTRALEPARVAAGGDDALGAAQLRALNRDAAGGAAGAEDEHPVAGADPRRARPRSQPTIPAMPRATAVASSTSASTGTRRSARPWRAPPSVPSRATPSAVAEDVDPRPVRRASTASEPGMYGSGGWPP